MRRRHTNRLRRAATLIFVAAVLVGSAGCKKKPKGPGLPATAAGWADAISVEEVDGEADEDDGDDGHDDDADEP